MPGPPLADTLPIVEYRTSPNTAAFRVTLTSAPTPTVGPTSVSVVEKSDWAILTFPAARPKNPYTFAGKGIAAFRPNHEEEPDMEHHDPDGRRLTPKRTEEIVWFGWAGHREAGRLGAGAVQ
jgi:hypothetical protein